MLSKNIFILNSKTLYDILIELKNLLNFNILQINEKDLNKNTFDNHKNYILLTNDLKNLEKNPYLDMAKVLVIDEIPIPIKKLIEKINIFILKESFQTQSKKKIKDYYFDLNDRTIFKKEKKVKLTEKELQLILYLDFKKDPQNIIKLQNEIWGYNKDLETHTVETHIYRLRKKIQKEFNDKQFIKSNKKGYSL
tara:strand:- start:879 stop:1460 length:582 start_codon:yes stop_codon:yes gene_type:complete